MVQRGEMKLEDPVAKCLPRSVKIPTRNGKEIRQPGGMRGQLRKNERGQATALICHPYRGRFPDCEGKRVANP